MKCPECGHENREAAKFCDECGHRLTEVPSPSEPRPILDAERKRVTALFSDISGYTAMTSKLDPEEVKEITSRVFDGVREVVDKYEGFIERFAGDGVLALFGVPKSHEDDPIRAVHAAKEIHELVESLSPRYEAKIGRPLSMHSGVNTGLAVTADVDPTKGTHGVTGDAINVAARLSDLAQAREILVGPDTYESSHSHFTFQPLTPTKVKGKSEPIPIYKVLSAKAPKTAVRLDRQVSSEMVGRDPELAKLELQILKAVNGEGSVVNVIGEAGIGKSRLIAELKKRDVMKRVTLLEGRAISIGKNLSFHPIIDLLKQWAGIAEDDNESSARDKLATAIRRVCGDDVDEVYPFVATMMGMKLTGRHAERVKGIEGEGLEKLIVKNVRELVIKGSEQRPSAIIMEDLHWADTSSIELLGSLYRLAEKHKLVFINVFRPGYFESDGGALAKVGERLPDYYVEIEIQPLDKNDSETLINNMLEIKGLPYSLKIEIVERAGGNPFFIEEVVRSLIDEGAVVRMDGGFEVTDKIHHVIIPPTINDVLMARIDRLEEQTRELVKIASVIGRSFFDRIIKDVAASIADVDERLAYLKDVQLIRDRTRMKELEYLFKHALAQEAAYESTLIQQRQTLHLKIAQSIEKLFNDRLHEFYGMLAYHYSKGDDLDKAEEYMTRAGEEALRASASSEALAYFQEALRLYLDKYRDDADPVKLNTFESNIAFASYYRGQAANAVRYFDRVMERWGARSPSNRLVAGGKLILDLAFLITYLHLPWSMTKNFPREEDSEFVRLAMARIKALVYIDNTRMFTEQLALVRYLGKFEMARIKYASQVWAFTGFVFASGGFSRLSDKCLEQSRAFLDQSNVGDMIAHNFADTACNLAGGRWHTMKDYDEKLVNLCVSKGIMFDTTSYLMLLGIVKAEQGDYESVVVLIHELSELGELYDNDNARIYCRYLRILSLFGRRETREVHALADENLSLVLEAGWELGQALYVGFKALALIIEYNVPDAKKQLLECEKLIGKGVGMRAIPLYTHPYLIAKFLYRIILLKEAKGGRGWLSIYGARNRAYKSGHMAVRNSAKYAPYRVWTYRLMGEYYWLINKQGNAMKWWDRAIKEGDRLGARPDLSRTYFEVGKRMLEPQSRYKQLNGIDANGYLEKAGILFEEMGLERDLEDLERVRMEM